MKVINGNRVPIMMWTDTIDKGALEQVIDLASLPFAYHHIAIMPDVHQGKGMPIGGVLATKGVLIPNAVGTDIGCGMCAIKTSLHVDDMSKQTLIRIINKIREQIPVGFAHHEKPQDLKFLPSNQDIQKLPCIKNLMEGAIKQIGTLGGGNHFIEIQSSTDGNIWIMLHSGSRNIGNIVCNYYNKIALHFNKLWYSDFIPGLEFLPIECKDGKNYFNEMRYCIDFGFANRKLMMQRICDSFAIYFPRITFDPMINIAHNYAAWERHFGNNVIVHRKGATRAMKGEIGIIPGSQGTKSYIVEGLGNANSFMSCSHGAGRVLGRSEARRQLDLQKEIDFMNAQGILHSIVDEKQLDEAPSAYKDITQVLANEQELVRPIVELSPLAVIKG